jgi:hypothetical protein
MSDYIKKADGTVINVKDTPLLVAQGTGSARWGGLSRIVRTGARD